MLKRLAIVIFVAASFACADPKPEFGNGRCTCGNSGICLQMSGEPQASATCAKTGGVVACAALSNANRSCWGSPSTAGLCLCRGLRTNLATAP